MLEERDRRALAEIEQRLTSDDPAFARRMRGGGRVPVIAVLCVTVFLALPFVAMLLGPVAALITAHLTALTVMLVVFCRRLRAKRP